MTVKVKLTPAQKRGLLKVAAGRVWRWAGGTWGQSGGRVRSSVFDWLLYGSPIELGAADGIGCRPAQLTPLGGEVLEAS